MRDSAAYTRVRKWWVEQYLVAWYALGWALIGVLLGVGIGAAIWR